VVGKNSKIQAKNPKIQGIITVITAKNQKINPFVGALNFWILDFAKNRGVKKG
jgi:hypothetical protein